MDREYNTYKVIIEEDIKYKPLWRYKISFCN